MSRDYTNKVLDRALQAIEALGYPEYVEMSLEELSSSLKIPKATLLSYLKTFERRQWLEQTEDGKWRVAPAVTRFAKGFERSYAKKVEELKILYREHVGEE